MSRHDTSIARWLNAAVADAEARGLPELKGLLEGLAESTRVLRAAELGGDALASGPAIGAGASPTNMSSALGKDDEHVGAPRPGEPGRTDADHR